MALEKENIRESRPLKPRQVHKEARRAAEDAAERLSDVCSELQDITTDSGAKRAVDMDYVLHELAQAQSAMSRARSYCESLSGEED